jgi:hypothetical protein
MREFKAEKDHGQREDEEVERLVRPQPKIKPPRRDRRREEIRPDADTDVRHDVDTKRDPDLSMNYKSIGGSVNRVARRFLGGNSNSEFDQWVKGKTFNHPKTRNKVQFGSLPDEEKERIRSEWGVDPDEDASPLTEKKEQPTAQVPAAKDSEEGGDRIPLGPMAPGAKDEAFYAAAGKSLRSALAKDAQLAEQVEIHLEKAKADPSYSNQKVQDYIQSKKIPKGVVTFVDLQKVLDSSKSPAEDFVNKGQHKDPDFVKFVDESEGTVTVENGEAKFVSQKGEKKGQKVPFEDLDKGDQEKWLRKYQQHGQANEHAEAIKADPTATSVAQQLLNPRSDLAKRVKSLKGNADNIDISKALPELAEAKLPPGVKSYGDFLRAVKTLKKPENSKDPEETKKTPGAKGEIPLPKRPPPARREIQEAVHLLMDTFPSKLVARFAGLHPADIRHLVDEYQLQRVIVKDQPVAETISKTAKNYFTDPEKVPTPHEVDVFRDGETVKVPFDTLSSKEQSDAMQKHRMAAVAQSLAARHTVLKHFKSNGVPPRLAGTLAGFALKGGKPQARFQQALKNSRNLFEAGATGGHNLSPKTKKAILASLGSDKASQALAVSYFQGLDLNETRKAYLSHGAVTRLSEREKPERIFDHVKKATREMRKRSAEYPKDVTQQLPDPAKAFRQRVIGQLRTLDPAKYEKVKRLFDHEDVRQYDHDFLQFKEAVEHWESNPNRDPYRGALPPVPPTRPANYYEVRGLDKYAVARLRAQEEEFAQRVQAATSKMIRPANDAKLKKSSFSSYGQRILIMRVASCSCGNSICTCGDTSGGLPKAAVYHGVDPYPKGKDAFGPYTKWNQAHQRDLADKDFDVILKAAREWLKSDTVKANTEGGVKDTQFRAALDLAIRDCEEGKYAGAIQPTVYNTLLAKLSKADDESGATVQKSAAKVASRFKKGSIEHTGERIRSLAVKVATVSPGVAYEMVDLAEAIVADKQPAEPVGYEALREAVLKLAHESPAAQQSLLPVLRLIKAQDEAKQIRATKARTSK